MVGENYTNTFGGENVHPTNLSYVHYTIEASIDLTWAFEAVTADYPTADKIEIDCQYANAMVRLPPADQVTVGQDILFGNTNALSYNVIDHEGNAVCVVDSGIEWFLYLTDNTTQAGVWRAVQFGASTSAGTAADMAGAGLQAEGTHLDQNIPTTPLTSSYTLTEADRATVLQNTGGGVTYTLPDAAAVADGWFVYIVNLGTGSVMLTPVGGDTIDGDAAKGVSPGESMIVLSDGVNFQSVGHGRSIDSNITAAGINAAGSGTLLLSTSQVSAQIQDFIGTLTGNRRIEYGAIPGYWFVYNKTDPLTPYTMTFALNPLDPGVLVPQGILPAGVFSILRSNGANMAVAFSGAVGTVTSVATTANMTGGPITSTGTLDLSNTGVTAGTYGDATHSVTAQIDIKGRVSTISAPAIAVPSTAITDLGLLLPPGTMVQYGGKNAPTSPLWLPCDGTTRLIESYPLLAAALNDAHGPLTGTTFTLPDTRGRVLAGMDAGTGRLRNDYFPGGNSNVVGQGGGVDAIQYAIYMDPLFVRVGGWAGNGSNYGWTGSGYTTGSQSVHYGAYTWTTYGSRGTVGGGDALEPHNHYYEVHANTSGESLNAYLNSFGAHGATDATWEYTDVRSNVQATLIIRHIIKT